MTNKIETDLEKMNKDRRRAEEAYLEGQKKALEIQRIQQVGINNPDELLLYVTDVIEDVKHSEDLARQQNNSIVYSEAIGIRREMSKLRDLIMLPVMRGREKVANEMEGTEEAHREKNKGVEGYA